MCGFKCLECWGHALNSTCFHISHYYDKFFLFSPSKATSGFCWQKREKSWTTYLCCYDLSNDNNNNNATFWPLLLRNKLKRFSLSFSPFLKRSTTIMEGWPLGTASTFISVSTRWQKKKENRCLPSRQFDYRNKKETVWLIAIERKWRKTKPVIDRFSICPTTRNRNTTTNPMLIFQLIQQQQLGVLFFCQPQQSGRLSPHFSLLSGSRFFFHLHHFLCSLHFVGSHFTLHKKMRLCWLALMPRSNDTRVFASERSDWNKMKTKRRVCWPLAAIR